MLLFGLRLSGLGRERPERGRTGIDRAVEATLPLHHQGTGRIELANDPPIAGPKVGSGVRDQLDHGPDTHTGSDSRGEQTCTCGIHTRS